MKIVPIYRIIFIVSVFFVSCADRYETIHEQSILIDKKNLRDDTLIKDSISQHYFSRIKRKGSYGRMLNFQLAKDQVGKEFYVVFEGRIRTNYPQSNSTISVATNDRSGNQIDWLVAFLKPFYSTVNEWCYFKDSVRIEHNKKGSKLTAISCFAYIPVGTDELFDMDSLRVAIKQKM